MYGNLIVLDRGLCRLISELVGRGKERPGAHPQTLQGRDPERHIPLMLTFGCSERSQAAPIRW